MFKLNEIYEVDRKNLKCDYLRYSPAEISTINTPDSQTFINTPKKDSVFSLLSIFFEKKFGIIKKTDNSRCAANGNDMRLVNLGPIGFLNNFKLTTSSGKHLEDISHSHIACLMYKVITASKSTDDMPIGFDSSRGRRKR